MSSVGLDASSAYYRDLNCIVLSTFIEKVIPFRGKWAENFTVTAS